MAAVKCGRHADCSEDGGIMNQMIRIADHPEYAAGAALWFHAKWGVPLAAYEESMAECIRQKNKIPQWYIVRDDAGNIIAGAGIIENDFHDRKDLAPNLCALFVEEAHRGQGLARRLLDFARAETAEMGYETLYLITTHTEFYERCGWNYLTTVNEDEGTTARMYAASAAEKNA